MGRAGAGGAVGIVGLIVYLLISQVGGGYEAGDLDEGDVREAVGASEAVGDDRLQRKATGSVNPDSFTHGSSEQRARWFNEGRASGDPGVCDTFSAEEV